MLISIKTKPEKSFDIATALDREYVNFVVMAAYVMWAEAAAAITIACVHENENGYYFETIII